MKIIDVRSLALSFSPTSGIAEVAWRKLGNTLANSSICRIGWVLHGLLSKTSTHSLTRTYDPGHWEKGT